MSFDLLAWVVNPNVWFLLGLLIIGVGVALDLMDVSIVLGLSAILLSLLMAFLPRWFASWEAVFFGYIGFSVAIFLFLLRFRRNINNDDFDVNDD